VDNSISVILTVHNQEGIITDVFNSIYWNISDAVEEIIIVYDGCTDNSKELLDKRLYNAAVMGRPKKIMVFETPDINEVMANNVGLRASACAYSIIIQDDCKITEPYFDLRMRRPFALVPDLLAVSGRDAVDTRIIDGRLDYYNCGGVDAGTPKNILSIRDGVNRSPLMLDNSKLKKLNYLDEDFAPLDSDDVDLSIRGYKEFGYLVGSYPVDFESPLHWGKTRSNPTSARIWEQSMRKNHQLILDRHYDFIVGEKHSMDMEID